jgi:hypothetical protein
LKQALEGGEQKGGSFTGTRLRLAGDIAALQQQGNGLSLYGCAVRKARFFNALHDFFGKIEAAELDVRKVCVSHGGLAYRNLAKLWT